MGVKLFLHNESAYEAAEKLLEETGRAAVIHPTGTGKSFVAFKLAEEHPEAHICWLSPSRYIFAAQKESYERASGQPVPGNLSFITYARLSMMEPEEMEGIRADYIILDEFHRCGAREWGSGVNALLDQCPQARVLGLSATHIRYLDNQRDMADELFGESIASEMGLGEAVVRGILPAPKYVVSLYSCRKDLERYRRRVERSGVAAAQAAEKYLEALRRALDKAEGLDVVFRKHMPNPHGKYLVFCANQEHMEEMVKKAPQWFRDVDRQPHIYKVYSQASESPKEYQKFVEDESDHLKLLYCINMLNEGIHVKGVTGVILLRPTVSPIIYKQQIGRALSATGGETPVIFDVVNNFENLYSISAVEREMREVITFYRNKHREEEIVQEGIEIIDEVRECRQLFERLEEALHASWEMMYLQAEIYYNTYGDLLIPKDYRTAANLPLGSWLLTQRRVRKGTCQGRLTDDQIAKLDRIGMVWENRQELKWEKGYDYARAYYQANGHLNVPAAYQTEDGFELGGWIASMRQLKSGVSKRRELSPERIEKLEAIGMIWNHSDYAFERNYLAAMEFSVKHGHLKVPAGYVCEDGFALGSWINRLKEKRAGTSSGTPLTEDQITRLDKIGMVWLNKYEDQWEKAFGEAEKWFREKGSLDIPVTCKSGDINLGKWICRQREMLKNGKISPEKKARLDGIGMAWNQEDPWEKSYEEARKYFQGHGDLEVPPQYIDGNGSWLGKWVSVQRKDNREGRLSPERADRLTAIGMRWESIQEQQWYAMYKRALTCMHDLDSPIEPGMRRQLIQWYDRQCVRRQDGKLTRQQTIWLGDLEKPIRALRADVQGTKRTKTTGAWQQ